MLLGDVAFQRKTFEKGDSVIQSLKSGPSLPDRKKSEQVNFALLKLIQEAKAPCFLLSSVLDFIEKVDREKILAHYTFTSFELWLNQKSGLSFTENLEIRAKIVGKRVPRSAYQAFFPIGMGKVYEGSHFVVGHKSPDLDTTIASFWGWLDAFGARVGDSLHIWNVPGGAPETQIEIEWCFKNLFGPAVLTHLPKTRAMLGLTGNDLMRSSSMKLKKLKESLSDADHSRDESSIVLVDEEGFYLGDWRSFDVEEIRRVLLLMNASFRWLESHIQMELISAFSDATLKKAFLEAKIDAVLSIPFKEFDPVQEFTKKQRHEVEGFLSKVLNLSQGMEASSKELLDSLSKFASIKMDEFEKSLQSFSSLFDAKGELLDKRVEIFSILQKLVGSLHETLLKVRERLEKLDVALKTKEEVFKRSRSFVSVRADVEEIRQKMESFLSLTVTYPDGEKLFPVGVIHAKDVRKPVLGTVSLRDFCNRDEMGIPDYLDIISVIDHHKTDLKTKAPPFAILSDAQSSNTLVAGQTFLINDAYSLRGQTEKGIEEQLQMSPSLSIQRKLLEKKATFAQRHENFIDPEREFTESLHFLYAILDDTDLLSKVTPMDVECVASLLNRMKSIVLKKEVEVVDLSDLPRDSKFAKAAAKRILQNEEMYSLYKKVYEHREKEVEKQIFLTSTGEKSNFFADTKVQNGLARVGQTKYFEKNIKQFEESREKVLFSWIKNAKEFSHSKPEVDLHIHMMSTIVSADEVYQGNAGEYSHQDELWIWVSSTEIAVEHLKRFLTAFHASPGLQNNTPEAIVMGPKGEEYKAYFKESFPGAKVSTQKGDESCLILRYKAGTLNSRKAMISPFLPN